MIGNTRILVTRKILDNLHLFSKYLQEPRLLHSFIDNKMKLYTDKGNLSSLKIVAACFYNNENVDIKFVSRKGT